MSELWILRIVRIIIVIFCCLQWKCLQPCQLRNKLSRWPSSSSLVSQKLMWITGSTQFQSVVHSPSVIKQQSCLYLQILPFGFRKDNAFLFRHHKWDNPSLSEDNGKNKDQRLAWILCLFGTAWILEIHCPLFISYSPRSRGLILFCM